MFWKLASLQACPTGLQALMRFSKLELLVIFQHAWDCMLPSHCHDVLWYAKCDADSASAAAVQRKAPARAQMLLVMEVCSFILRESQCHGRCPEAGNARQKPHSSMRVADACAAMQQCRLSENAWHMAYKPGRAQGAPGNLRLPAVTGSLQKLYSISSAYEDLTASICSLHMQKTSSENPCLLGGRRLNMVDLTGRTWGFRPGFV